VIVIGEWIYFEHSPGYNQTRGYITKIKNDGSEKTKFSECTTQTLYYDEDWFYTDQNMKLTKVKIDGSEIMQLDNEQPITIAVTNDWIYYEIVDWANNKFARYRIKKDGTNKQRVDEGIRNNFMNFSGEWLYYTIDDHSMYFPNSLTAIILLRNPDGLSDGRRIHHARTSSSVKHSCAGWYCAQYLLKSCRNPS
jgi:hypothetical protein